MALGIDDAGVAQLLEVVAQRGLGDVEERHELADADRAGVLAQHVHELQPDRVPEGFGDVGQTGGLFAVDVGVDDGLAARRAGGPLGLRLELQIDVHRNSKLHKEVTFVDCIDICR